MLNTVRLVFGGRSQRNDMAEEVASQRWWESIPKILAVITGVVTAVTGLVVAINQLDLHKPKKESLAISIPRPISPADGISFSQYPRTVTLAWKAVPGAMGYKVEIEFDGSGGQASPKWTRFGLIRHVNATTYTFDFIGNQAGRWRVWAVDAKGQDGSKSDWWVFFFTR
jgi:hypothetical protein